MRMNTRNLFGLLLTIAVLASNPNLVQAQPTSIAPLNGKGKVQLPDSGEYEGEFQDGMLHGKGTIRWRNGDIYVGEFSRGLLHGEGTFTRPKSG